VDTIEPSKASGGRGRLGKAGEGCAPVRCGKAGGEKERSTFHEVRERGRKRKKRKEKE